MQVKGQARLPARRAKVWATLLDAGALRQCLPGCKQFDEVAPAEWEATLSIGLAGITGTYKGRVRISEQQPETSYRLSVEGSGSGNRIRGSALITLSDGDDGGTVVDYDGEAQIAGTLAAVGQRLFEPAARMMADQFFRCMGNKVTG
ncbi:MAG TPA: carbon monoxide dehydrogenase subunit G [Chloroflexota bacterium]|nr:carbon monoxide dehydrogenase subunit G [Chloroflexota bacterium]